MEFWNRKATAAQLSVLAWSCARRAIFYIWLHMQLECLQLWHAQFAATPQWQIQCCYATDVTMDITCTALRRHWNKYQMVSGAARSVRSPEIHMICV